MRRRSRWSRSACFPGAVGGVVLPGVRVVAWGERGGNVVAAADAKDGPAAEAEPGGDLAVAVPGGGEASGGFGGFGRTDRGADGAAGDDALDDHLVEFVVVVAGERHHAA